MMLSYRHCMKLIDIRQIQLQQPGGWEKALTEAGGEPVEPAVYLRSESHKDESLWLMMSIE